MECKLWRNTAYQHTHRGWLSLLSFKRQNYLTRRGTTYGEMCPIINQQNVYIRMYQQSLEISSFKVTLLCAKLKEKVTSTIQTLKSVKSVHMAGDRKNKQENTQYERFCSLPCVFFLIYVVAMYKGIYNSSNSEAQFKARLSYRTISRLAYITVARFFL